MGMSNKHPGTQHNYNPETGEWNDSLVGEFLWSNVNVSEAVPDVMTPSTWSLWQIYHYETNPVRFPGNYPFCGNICGRPYINLSLLDSMYRAIGRDARKELQGDLIGSAPADMDIPRIHFSAFSVYRTVLPGVLKAHWDAYRDQKKIAEFLTNVPGWCSTTRTAIAGCRDDQSMLSLWKKSIRPCIVRACGLLRSVTMTLAEPATHLRQELTTLIGETDANAILSNLSGASGDLASLGPLMGLEQVVNGRMSREAYLESYGHRGPHEMELFACGSDEDQAWFEKRLVDFTRSTISVDALLAHQRAEQIAAWRNFEVRCPGKVQSIKYQLEKVAVAARNREAVRSEVTRITRLVRQFLLIVGKMTGVEDGVFFLTLDEMTAVLAGDKSPVTSVPARRETYLKYCALPPYPTMIIGHFDPFAWAADPQRRSDYFDSRQPKSLPDVNSNKESAVTGFPGAVGIVEGTVRRLDKPEDGSQLQPGEILVTVTTNVGWTPLFPRLAAIVTDVGAPLSHAAIVARELGIPAVVGCGNATMRLKTGDRVRVDGGRGVVDVLE
jgi:phosphohistidine swiveling domain-containing protein